MRTELSFYPGEIEVMRSAPSDQPTGEWAREHVIVPEGPSDGASYDPDLAPYFVQLWDILLRPWVRRMCVAAAPQIGKTLFGQVFLARRSVERPGPRHVWLPDKDLVEDWFEKKIVKMFQRSPKLRRLVGRDRYAVDSTSIALANGSTITGRWAGSPSKRASLSAIDGLGDEPDMMPAGAHADFEERCRAFEHLYKILWIGKPIGLKEESWLWGQIEGCDVVLRFEARCPACREYQEMKFEQIRVPDGMRDPQEIRQKGTARYVCAQCGYQWTDQIRNRAVLEGRWNADRHVERPHSVGVYLPSWYSRWVSMSTVMADWFAAQGDPEKLKSWWNGHAAQPLDVVVSETSEERLSALIVPEMPPQVVPEQTVALTLSADMQKDHFRYSICAHCLGGDGKSAWIVDYGTLGSHDDLGRMVFETRLRREGGGQRMGIWRAAVDTGGTRHEGEDESNTQRLWEWLVRQPRGVLFGTKGMSRRTPGQHVTFSRRETFPNGRSMPHAVRLYFVDTLAMKDLIFWRLSEESTEPIHFHASTGPSYIREIVSEKKIMEKGKYVWKQIRANHYLDCLVGHMAMEHWQWAPSLDLLTRKMQAEQQHGRNPTSGGTTINPYTGEVRNVST